MKDSKTKNFTITGIPGNQYKWLLEKSKTNGLSVSSYVKTLFVEEIKRDEIFKRDGDRK